MSRQRQVSLFLHLLVPFVAWFESSLTKWNVKVSQLNLRQHWMVEKRREKFAWSTSCNRYSSTCWMELNLNLKRTKLNWQFEFIIRLTWKINSFCSPLLCCQTKQLHSSLHSLTVVVVGQLFYLTLNIVLLFHPNFFLLLLLPLRTNCCPWNFQVKQFVSFSLWAINWRCFDDFDHDNEQQQDTIRVGVCSLKDSFRVCVDCFALEALFTYYWRKVFDENESFERLLKPPRALLAASLSTCYLNFESAR